MQKDFCLGSQWLYYKIYTGVKTADYILLQKLNPIILELEDKKIIKKWFFLRYKDTDEHFRIRFLLNNSNDLVTVIQLFYPVFNYLIEENLVWKIQTDTYKREVERYGNKTIEESEFLFWKDSKMIMQYLELIPSMTSQETPLLFSFYAIDTFLNLFQLSNGEKLLFMVELLTSYTKEFDVEREQKKQMDRNYRLLRPKIESLLSTTCNNSNFNEIVNIVDEKSKQTQKIILDITEKIEISIYSFLSSHIHMMLNRQYSSKQRMYELIIYDHLYRHYKAKNFKNNV